MHDRRNVALAPRAAVWPPDDTEESVMGTDFHQTAITNLRTGINEAAAMQTPAGGPPPWQAGGQTTYRGYRRPNGSAYTTLPDIFVVRRPFDRRLESLTLAEHGTPLLIIEVLSKTTHEQDLDLENGKGYSYRAAGVGEYLTLDPLRAYLPEGGRGWQLDAAGGYQPWPRQHDGRWMSRGLPLAFALEGVQVAVFTAAGYRLLREGEVERERSTWRRRWTEERARREAEVAAKDEELTRLRRRLEELEHGQ